MAEVRLVSRRLASPREAVLAPALVPCRCPLPLRFGREALIGPTRERVRLVPGDVLHGLVRRDRLAPAEADALPAVLPALPEERRSHVLSLAPLPSFLAPMLLRAIPAVGDEVRDGRVRDGHTIDEERPELDLV